MRIISFANECKGFVLKMSGPVSVRGWHYRVFKKSTDLKCLYLNQKLFTFIALKCKLKLIIRSCPNLNKFLKWTPFWKFYKRKSVSDDFEHFLKCFFCNTYNSWTNVFLDVCHILRKFAMYLIFYITPGKEVAWVKSGERRGYANGPPLLVHLFGSLWFEYCSTIFPRCEGAPFCW